MSIFMMIVEVCFWMGQILSWFLGVGMIFNIEGFEAVRSKKHVIICLVPFGWLYYVYWGVVFVSKSLVSNFKELPFDRKKEI